jgi:hypothetical protein
MDVGSLAEICPQEHFHSIPILRGRSGTAAARDMNPPTHGGMVRCGSLTGRLAETWFGEVDCSLGLLKLVPHRRNQSYFPVIYTWS